MFCGMSKMTLNWTQIWITTSYKLCSTRNGLEQLTSKWSHNLTSNSISYGLGNMQHLAFRPGGQQNWASVILFKTSLPSCELTGETLSPPSWAGAEFVGKRLCLLPLAPRAQAPHGLSQLCFHAHVSALKLHRVQVMGPLCSGLFLGSHHLRGFVFLISILSHCQISKTNKPKTLYSKQLKCLIISLFTAWQLKRQI